VPPQLTTYSFLKFDSFYAVYEKSAMEDSLDTFLKVYDKNKKTIVHHIASLKDPEYESSRNFLVVIRFLRHFKGHYRQLDLKEPEIEKTLHREIMGLMASILQAIMNVYRVSDTVKTRLRNIFLGDKFNKCMSDEQRDINEHFVYMFPSRFIDKEWIEGNWFTSEIAKNTAKFVSSDIGWKIYEFVTQCFVDLYERELKVKFGDADHKKAVNKLKNKMREMQ